jgi:Family of unknown function (DUF6093)
VDVRGRLARAGVRALRSADKRFSIEVAVGRPGQAVGGRDSQELPLRVVYRGRAHLGAVGSGGQADIGDRLSYMSAGSLVLPLNGPWDGYVQVNDLVEVRGHFDAEMVGRWFRVVNVDGAGVIPVGRRCAVTSVQRDAAWTWVLDEPCPTEMVALLFMVGLQAPDTGTPVFAAPPVPASVRSGGVLGFRPKDRSRER